VSLNGSCEQ